MARNRKGTVEWVDNCRVEIMATSEDVAMDLFCNGKYDQSKVEVDSSQYCCGTLDMVPLAGVSRGSGAADHLSVIL